MKINTQEIVNGNVVVVTRDMTAEEEAEYIQNQPKVNEPERSMEERIAQLEQAIRELTGN